MKVYKVNAEWDAEAQVWFVTKSNVPGLNAEAATLEELREELMELVPRLVSANVPGSSETCEVPLELLARQHSKLKIGGARC